MRKLIVAASFAPLLLTGCEAVRPASDGNPTLSRLPPPPPRPMRDFTRADIRKQVEQKVLETLGEDALRRGRDAPTSIMAVSYQGRFDTGGPRANVAVRDRAGWSGWKSSRPGAMAAAAGAELDRLLQDPAFWREEPFYPEMDCPDAGATMMVIWHEGRTRVTRQGCSPAGLTGRMEETVLGERVPA